MKTKNNPQRAASFISIGLIALLSACSSMTVSKSDAVAEVSATSGSSVAGKVTFSRVASGGVHVEADITGLTPGEHGFHVHEVGDCSAPDATSAKGHFNPNGMHHGSQEGEHHVGDMQNMVADADGKAHYSGDFSSLTIGSGDGDILGKAVIIHAAPDDYKTQPAGNSGKRVACGVIKSS